MTVFSFHAAGHIIFESIIFRAAIFFCLRYAEHESVTAMFSLIYSRIVFVDHAERVRVVVLFSLVSQRTTTRISCFFVFIMLCLFSVDKEEWPCSVRVMNARHRLSLFVDVCPLQIKFQPPPPPPFCDQWWSVCGQWWFYSSSKKMNYYSIYYYSSAQCALLLL